MRQKKALLWPILFLLLAVLFALSIMVGRYSVSLGDTLKMLFSPLIPFKKTWSDTVERVVFSIRLPRITMALLAGLALAVSGAAYQGVFQNPMASPDILGSSQGAAFGAALAILLRMQGMAIMASAFLMSIATVTLVYLLSRRLATRRTTGLILCGIMVGSLCNAGTSFVKLVADPTDQLPAITYWLMGSLSGLTWKSILMILPPLLLGIVPLYLVRWKIDLLCLGDEEAKVLGLDTERIRRIIILCSTLATSSIIASCGMIGWVGLVVPHLARRLVGDGNRKVIPLSMLIGAIFLLLVDDFARCLLKSEIPIGILTSFIGAPFFIFLMFKKEAGHEH